MVTRDGRKKSLPVSPKQMQVSGIDERITPSNVVRGFEFQRDGTVRM